VRCEGRAAVLSDDVLGLGLSLVGLSVDPSACLSPASSAAWARAGGTLAAFDAVTARGGGVRAADTLGARLAPRKRAQPWCVVVRPDRTILHDGPAREADRLVAESLRLIGVST
jgi:3-(3-hydroxy-phenyl)propionate hydroxylase